MDESQTHTKNHGFVLAATCSEVEERVIVTVPSTERREELVRRARWLRREFQSWAESPPDKTQRFERWMELVALELDAEVPSLS